MAATPEDLPQSDIPVLHDRIDQLWSASDTVLAANVMPNGCIVAANNHRLDYPKTAEGYGYVWMRDNAYNLVAASVLNPGMASDRTRAYQQWLWDRAEGFAEPVSGLPYPEGVVLKRYEVNGVIDRRYG